MAGTALSALLPSAYQEVPPCNVVAHVSSSRVGVLIQSGNTGQPHTSGICHPGILPCSALVESPVLLCDSRNVRVLPPQGHPIGRMWPGEQRWAQPCPSASSTHLGGVSPYSRVGSGSDTPFPFTLKAFIVLSIATFLVRK